MKAIDSVPNPRSLAVVPENELEIWHPTTLVRGDTFAFGEGPRAVFVSLHDGEKNRVLASTDDGAAWHEVAGLPAGSCVVALAASEDGVFAATLEQGVLFSSGSGWTAVGGPALEGSEVVSLALRNSILFAGTRSKGIFRLEGEEWRPFSDGLPSHRAGIVSLAATGEGLLASETTNLFRRDSADRVWTGLNPCLPAGRIPHGVVAHSGSEVVGWGAHGIYRSEDGGRSWISLADRFWRGRFVRGLVVHRADIYACTQGEAASEIYVSADGGESWSAFGSGLPRPAWTQAIGISGDVLLAGAGSHGVWRRKLTGAERRRPRVPLKLHQNEPNPFSGATRIRFTMRTPRKATLELLDLRDRVLKVLWSGTANSGVHEVVLDDTSLAPGIYTYRLRSESVAQSRRLVLLG